MAKIIHDTYAQILVELGSISTFDPKRLSFATLQSVASHIRLLKRNNVILTPENFQRDGNKIINGLLDKNNKPLNVMYKRQIAITIKRLFPISNINFNEYSTAGQNRKNKTRLAKPAFFESIKRIVDRASLIVKETYNKQRIEDLGLYDASLAVLLTICTSLRINEILQLKLADIPTILNDEPVMIYSKGGNQVRNIAKNEILVSLFKTIQNQRPLVESYVNNRIFDKIHELQEIRLNSGYLLISSADYMRKKLHEMASSMQIKSQPLGFNSFRKFIVTMLIDGGGHEVAQSMNNHQSINTTLDNYNVVGPQLAENTYAKLIPPLHPMPVPPLQLIQENNINTNSIINNNTSNTNTETTSQTVENGSISSSSQVQSTQNNTLFGSNSNRQLSPATEILYPEQTLMVMPMTTMAANNFDNSNLSTRQGFLRNTSAYYSPRSMDIDDNYTYDDKTNINDDEDM